MTYMTEAAWIWAAKGVGAVAGSAVSLAYVLPHGRREAALRFFAGLVCGLVFGGAVGAKLAARLDIADQMGSGETMLMGSAVASLLAWWALGFFRHLFERGALPKGTDKP
ncbi:hypothetical protein GA830_11000 [Mesorhizobium sp. NBSH29]|uniref:DUF6107 family protein n=1 Tax=Mesorhizobium sp. NBSH29 TaxID=2654249 RepID=UPI0018964F60|nr:DUF6107 family protein [Mesorhizobium sp. NBSH29]QPC87208.1 hypothetical protein GA830_11000 [Mesorhizobium sp. NBSH29]